MTVYYQKTDSLLSFLWHVSAERFWYHIFIVKL